jgi:DNA-binding SARP family transcriptional activator
MTLQNGFHTTMIEAAVSALWAAALLDDQTAVESWLQVTANCNIHDVPDSYGRWLLAKYYASLPNQEVELSLTDTLCAIETVEHSLTPAESTALRLLRATLLLEQKGWEAAAVWWEACESAAVELPEDMLVALYRPHRQLIKTAELHGSNLARKLLPRLPRVWRIQTLGDFSCIIDGSHRTLKPLYQALLVRIVDAGPGGVTIAQLIEDIWGGRDIAMSGVHQALRRLREETGLHVSIHNGRCAIWEAEFWAQIRYDVREFEQALRPPLTPNDIDRAIQLYHGDFFSCAWIEAEAWADRRREALRNRFVDALEAYGQSLESSDPRRSIDVYTQALRIDGTREPVVIGLMNLAGRFGNTVLLHTTFEQHRHALRKIGVDPEENTLSAYQQYANAIPLDVPQPAYSVGQHD